jgi:antimicrobial peptide system SdpB family protein
MQKLSNIAFMDQMNWGTYFLNIFEKNHSHNRNIIVARLLLAAGLLFTILFNDVYTIFRPTEISFESPICLQYNFFGIFCLLNKHLWAAKLISIIMLVFTISGYFPLIGNIFLWYVSFSFYSSSLIIDGGDQVTLVISALMIPIFLANNDVNIYTNRKLLSSSKFNFLRTSIATIVFFFVILQVVVLYLQAGIAKLYTTEWANGTALYYWLHTDNLSVTSWVTYLLDPFLSNKYLLPLFTWSVIGFEVLLAFSSLFSYKLRKIVFLLGVGFHFFIVIIFGLFSFFFAMTAALFLLLRPLNNVNNE